MEAEAPESSPIKSVSGELERLRAEFRAALESYATRLEEELSAVQQRVQALESKKKVPTAKLRDIRDMLTLLRKFSIKPEKGRRKDLKKIDSLVGDLSMLVEHWE
jgi:predicted  nucleic acid-binding Zn-ribbon protein